MKNKFTTYLFMLTIISIIGLSASSLFAITDNSGMVGKQLTATITGANSVCQGTDGVEYSTEPGMDNYIWEVSDGGMITAGEGTSIITVSWRLSGDQLVTVKYNDPVGIGLVVSSSYPVFVNQIPDDPGIITGPTRVCQGETEAVYTVPPINNATSYEWFIPEGATIISGTNTNTIKLNYSLSATPGSVVVYGVNDCGEGNISANHMVMINEIPPTPTITLTEDLLQSTSVDGNQWYLNGEIIQGATRQSHQATEAGRYYSVVTLGGCSSAVSNKIDIDAVLTGIKEKGDAGFQLFPVPNNGLFTVKFNGSDKTGLKIQVYNNLGMIVYEKNEIDWDENSTYSVDLHSLSAGTYAVILQNDKYHLMNKMVIRK